MGLCANHCAKLNPFTPPGYPNQTMHAATTNTLIRQWNLYGMTPASVKWAELLTNAEGWRSVYRLLIEVALYP